ncbi:hypothetical protein OG689_10890 [Kitasatospora sp. NBC_00240]|uniref:hypothetical protein n=1 Tax=Kitasatospora sp. NBC_00240 TaxID=2903567 RepID=UPI00225B8D09|nr:hypothetical protein [Kitasatospora sp. NBC_00240]MCX5209790.1 hypothetical protein [Kitasatospora sp. NBC_00240]
MKNAGAYLTAKVISIFWNPQKTLYALAGFGLAGIFTGTNPITEARTPLIIGTAILAALDTIAWYLTRNHATWLLTITNPDGSPYVAPWGEDCGMEIDNQDELQTRVTAVTAAGLVPHVHQA